MLLGMSTLLLRILPEEPADAEVPSRLPLCAGYIGRAACQRAFPRLGLSQTIVAATSGAMGGSASEEFLATAGVGEDTFVGCASHSYTANTEAVVTSAPPAREVTAPPPVHRGRASAGEGYAEIRDRHTGERDEVAVTDIPRVITRTLG